MLPFRMSEIIRGLPGFLLAGNWKKNILMIRTKQLPVLVQLRGSRRLNDESWYSPVRAFFFFFAPVGSILEQTIDYLNCA